MWICEDPEDHMKQTIPSFEEFYGLISACIVETKGKIAILDLGCGTGIELEGIFSFHNFRN